MNKNCEVNMNIYLIRDLHIIKTPVYLYRLHVAMWMYFGCFYNWVAV